MAIFERFTERARRVVVLAQEQARELGHKATDTEHILLGLIAEDAGVAARSLKSLGLDLEEARKQVIAIIGEGPGNQKGHLPFTPKGKKVLELALRESLQLGHNYIGTEHILLGLIREGQGVGAIVLQGLGLGRVRAKVINTLAGSHDAEKQIEKVSRLSTERLARLLTKRGAAWTSDYEVTERVKRLASFAAEIAIARGADVFDVEDVLFALMKEDHIASAALGSLGADLETLMARVEELRKDEEGKAVGDEG